MAYDFTKFDKYSKRLRGFAKLRNTELRAWLVGLDKRVAHGRVTWSGSGATLTATVAGVLATDTVVATINTKPTQAAYLVRATPGTDQIVFELSAANTSNDAVIGYTVLR